MEIQNAYYKGGFNSIWNVFKHQIIIIGQELHQS